MVISGVCPAMLLLPPIPGGEAYGSPSGNFANNCTCSSVFYSLASACAACQNADWLPWSIYSQNCSSTFLMQYPETVPNDTDIPHWAYLDVAVEGTFDLNLASLAGDTPESTAPPSATSTSMSSTSSVSSTSTSLPSSAPTASSASQSSKTATSVIAGCVVGGIVGGTFIAALAFWFYKSGMASKLIAQMSAQTSGQEMLASSGTRLPFQPVPRRPYDPDDPTTFPPPMDQLTQISQLSVGTDNAGLPRSQRSYTGMPEV
ncbi:hypothetical protein AX14_002414 [Amanita brunnescens Koide BX004]|nr:hypothetical protein AX14_002414 [Amanita brunnescens Koide BX004]